MANYTAIVEVGNALIERLKEGLVPEVIPGGHSIGLCSPAEKGDYSLGLHLYDIRECEDMRYHDMVHIRVSSQQLPPMLLSLYYMVTAYSDSDLKFRAAQEQRILGRVLQLFYDEPLISAEKLGSSALGMDMRIELLNPDLDEKLRIWNMPDIPYKASLFYRITPVELDSVRTQQITRVTQLSFGLKEQ